MVSYKPISFMAPNVTPEMLQQQMGGLNPAVYSNGFEDPSKAFDKQRFALDLYGAQDPDPLVGGWGEGISRAIGKALGGYMYGKARKEERSATDANRAELARLAETGGYDNPEIVMQMMAASDPNVQRMGAAAFSRLPTQREKDATRLAEQRQRAIEKYQGESLGLQRSAQEQATRHQLAQEEQGLLNYNAERGENQKRIALAEKAQSPEQLELIQKIAAKYRDPTTAELDTITLQTPEGMLSMQRSDPRIKEYMGRPGVYEVDPATAALFMNGVLGGQQPQQGADAGLGTDGGMQIPDITYGTGGPGWLTRRFNDISSLMGANAFDPRQQEADNHLVQINNRAAAVMASAINNSRPTNFNLERMLAQLPQNGVFGNPQNMYDSAKRTLGQLENGLQQMYRAGPTTAANTYTWRQSLEELKGVIDIYKQTIVEMEKGGRVGGNLNVRPQEQQWIDQYLKNGK